MLLEWNLPRARNEASYVLIVVQYHQTRNHKAYQFHRKRRMTELGKWNDLKT